MCGRYCVDAAVYQEMLKLAGEIDGQLWKNGDIHPTDRAFVLTAHGGRFSAEQMKWGFPRQEGSGVLINARAETALEKKTFRDSVLYRRCIIPACHFYEWDRTKVKAEFTRPDNPVLYMAGFYREFTGQPSFMILTTAANASVSMVHDRMPLLLDEDELGRWLRKEEAPEPFLHKQQPRLSRRQEYEQLSLFT